MNLIRREAIRDWSMMDSSPNSVAAKSSSSPSQLSFPSFPDVLSRYRFPICLLVPRKQPDGTSSTTPRVIFHSWLYPSPLLQKTCFVLSDFELFCFSHPCFSSLLIFLENNEACHSLLKFELDFHLRVAFFPFVSKMKMWRMSNHRLPCGYISSPIVLGTLICKFCASGFLTVLLVLVYE